MVWLTRRLRTSASTRRFQSVMGPRGWRRSRSPGVGIGCVPALAAALSAHLRLSAWRLDTAFCVSEVLIFKFEIHDLISGRPGSSYRVVYVRGTSARLTSATTPVTVLTLTVVVGGQSGQSSGATRRAGRSSNRNANARVLRRAPARVAAPGPGGIGYRVGTVTD